MLNSIKYWLKLSLMTIAALSLVYSAIAQNEEGYEPDPTAPPQVSSTEPEGGEEPPPPPEEPEGSGTEEPPPEEPVEEPYQE